MARAATTLLVFCACNMLRLLLNFRACSFLTGHRFHCGQRARHHLNQPSRYQERASECFGTSSCLPFNCTRMYMHPTHTRANAHTYTYINIYIYIYIYIYACAFAFTRTHTHAHAHNPSLPFASIEEHMTCLHFPFTTANLILIA